MLNGSINPISLTMPKGAIKIGAGWTPALPEEKKYRAGWTPEFDELSRVALPEEADTMVKYSSPAS
jgi:hypothetical protein